MIRLTRSSERILIQCVILVMYVYTDRYFSLWIKFLNLRKYISNDTLCFPHQGKGTQWRNLLKALKQHSIMVLWHHRNKEVINPRCSQLLPPLTVWVYNEGIFPLCPRVEVEVETIRCFDIVNQNLYFVVNKPCDWLKQITWSVSANRMVCLLQSTSFGLQSRNTL